MKSLVHRNDPALPTRWASVLVLAVLLGASSAGCRPSRMPLMYSARLKYSLNCSAGGMQSSQVAVAETQVAGSRQQWAAGSSGSVWKGMRQPPQPVHTLAKLHSMYEQQAAAVRCR